MTHVPGTTQCPRGHSSSEPDYCSECGAKIAGATPLPAAGGVGLSASASQVCPDCGTPREQTGIAFCEVCGYNFNTGAHGELSIVAAAEAPPPVPLAAVESERDPESERVQADTCEDISGPGSEATAPFEPESRWAVVVSVDPSLRKPESPEPPPDVGSFTIQLEQPLSLVGRTNEARAIFPEIALPFDEAVSRRHALLQLSETGALSLRDIGSANGTQLNGTNVAAMTDMPLKAGDEITLGHWTRLTVQGTV